MAYQQSSKPGYVITAPSVVQGGFDAGYVRDYLVWSIVNLFCGWGILGVFPLVCSIMCRNDKTINNYSGAQSWSTLALVSNIFITITGAIGWIIFIVFMVIFVSAASSLPTFGPYTFPTTTWPLLTN